MLRSVVVVLGLQGLLGAVARGQTAPCVVPPTTRSVPGGIVANLRPVVADTEHQAYLSQMLMTIGEFYHPRGPLKLAEYMGRADIASAAAYLAGVAGLALWTAR